MSVEDSPLDVLLPPFGAGRRGSLAYTNNQGKDYLETTHVQCVHICLITERIIEGKST
jgi:hypothetical protein